MKITAVAPAASAAPPITVTGLSLLGFPLADWVMLATLIYTIVLTIIKIDNYIRARNDRRSAVLADRE